MKLAKYLSGLFSSNAAPSEPAAPLTTEETIGLLQSVQEKALQRFPGTKFDTYLSDRSQIHLMTQGDHPMLVGDNLGVFSETAVSGGRFDTMLVLQKDDYPRKYRIDTQTGRDSFVQAATERVCNMLAVNRDYSAAVKDNRPAPGAGSMG